MSNSKEIAITTGYKAVKENSTIICASVTDELGEELFRIQGYAMEKLGYKVSPRYNEVKADIVLNIEFRNKYKLIDFCKAIQSSSAIDSFVEPTPSDMPGYDSQVIMASGSFTQGSSIELSCDGPLREPYIAYLQGSLTYDYGKIAVINVVNKFMEKEENKQIIIYNVDY